MNPLPRSLTALATAALLAAAGSAQAAITVYTTQYAFLGAVNGAATDTFEDMGTLDPEPGPLTRSVGPYSYTAAAGPDSPDFYTAGLLNVWLTTQEATDTITFNAFTGGVSAIGGRFFGSDSAGHINPGESLMITATDAGGSVSQTLVDARRFSFLGFVSDGLITSLTVTAVQPLRGGVYPTVNNLVLASAVPEPETYALLLAGLVGVGLLMRRRLGDDMP